MTVTAGDGIHIRSTFSPITIESVRCVENHRVGILVDLGAGSTDDVSFSAVTVVATGERFGAVAGRGTTTIVAVPPGDGGWDDGITREGDAVLNDTERFGDFSLDIVDSPAPPDAPNPADAVGIITPEC